MLELVEELGNPDAFETLYVAASLLPLTQPQCEMLRILCPSASPQRGETTPPKPKSGPDSAGKPPPPPKEAKPIAERTLLYKDGPFFIRRAQVDRNGFALISIILRHASR